MRKVFVNTNKQDDTSVILDFNLFLCLLMYGYVLNLPNCYNQTLLNQIFGKLVVSSIFEKASMFALFLI